MPEQLLAASMAALATELNHLRVGVDAETEQRRRENRITLSILGVVLVLMLGLGIVAIQNNQINRSNAETNTQIRDCTTIGGKCYELGRRQAAINRQKLIDGSVATAWCARNLPGAATRADISKCVDRELAKIQDAP